MHGEELAGRLLTKQQTRGLTPTGEALDKSLTPQVVAGEAEAFLTGMEDLVRARHKMEQLERQMREYVDQVGREPGSVAIHVHSISSRFFRS